MRARARVMMVRCSRNHARFFELIKRKIWAKYRELYRNDRAAFEQPTE